MTYWRPHSISVSFKNSPLMTRHKSPFVIVKIARPVSGKGNKLYCQYCLAHLVDDRLTLCLDRKEEAKLEFSVVPE